MNFYWRRIYRAISATFLIILFCCTFHQLVRVDSIALVEHQSRIERTSARAVDNSHLKSNLKEALSIANNIIESIHQRWEIDNFPNFLQSVSMSSHAWNQMQAKFKDKIIQSQKSQRESESNSSHTSTTFVMSFLGSSVTAGHDCPMNQTISRLILHTMSPAFKALGIELISRSGAVGNNPCMPYDLCTTAFAGEDSDLIQWEQSYDCSLREKSGPIIEQFIRQCQTFRNIPVVIISESSTPNWKPSDCSVANMNQSATPSMMKISALRFHLDALRKNPRLIATTLNNQTVKDNFHELSRLFDRYDDRSAIQLWYHSYYTAYKCLGPYHKDWGCCSVGWHPSLLGHQLRADHYAFFWLLIYRDALTELTMDLQQFSINMHNRMPFKIKPPIYSSTFVDNLQCYTAYLPNHNPSLTALQSRIVASFPESRRAPFRLTSIESLMQMFIGPDVFKKNRLHGYIDVKNTYFGNIFMDPLSIAVTVKQEGFGFLCEPSLVRGRLPSGSRRLWSPSTKIYITNKTQVYETFVFNISLADRLPVMCALNYGTNVMCPNPKDIGATLCAQTIQKMKPGNYVITIIPTSVANVMLSTILIP